MTRYRILVVEDHLDTSAVYLRMLRRQGFTVTVVTTYHEALDHCRCYPVDLVLADIGLPDGNGWELMRRAKTEQSFPAIAISAYGGPDDINRSHEAGFAQHLIKPVTMETLMAAIQQVLFEPNSTKALPEDWFN